MTAGEGSGLPPLEAETVQLGRIPALHTAHNSSRAINNNLGASLDVGLLVPFLLLLLISERTKKGKVCAVSCEVEEPGLPKRNLRFLRLVESPWEGTNTSADLFEQACYQHKDHKCLGSREILTMGTATNDDVHILAKVMLGKYSWLTYAEVLAQVDNVASGLVALSHTEGERIAICAETRAEWLLGLQACFWQNFAVVTIYASLGEDALLHSLNEDNADRSPPPLLKNSGGWVVESFSTVEKLGKGSPIPTDKPKPNNMAVIMYTSRSTGMPEGVMMSHANIVAKVAGVMSIIPSMSSNDTYLAYLPSPMCWN